MHRRRRLVLDIVGILMYKIVAEVRAADSSKRGNFSNPDAPQGGAAAASSRFAQTERRDGTPERAAQREDERRAELRGRCRAQRERFELWKR